MKKIISLILCSVLLLCTVLPIGAWEPTSNDYTKIPRGNDVIARIVFGSDTHIGYGDASDKFKNAYDAIGKLGGADALVIAGDLTDSGSADEYRELMGIVSANSKKLTVDVFIKRKSVCNVIVYR